MTATPAYGFQLTGGAAGKGLMQKAIGAGDTEQIKQLLTGRFPGLRFEPLTDEEQVAAPQETTTAAAPSPLAQAAATEAAQESSTASLYNNYLGGLPSAARDLVTTDYKGVRGGRVGRGNYTTASMTPGAQVAPVPTPTPTPTPTGGGGGGTTTTVGGDYTQYLGDYYAQPVNYGTYYAGAQKSTGETTPAATPTPTTTSVGNWWLGKSSEEKAKAASKGLVPSATTVGAYVSPTSASANTGAQPALSAIQGVSSGGSAARVQAAAKSDENNQKLSRSEVSALISSGVSAQKVINQAEKQNITLSNATRQALEKQASKSDNKKK